jgi:hypothetical protein
MEPKVLQRLVNGSALAIHADAGELQLRAEPR